MLYKYSNEQNKTFRDGRLLKSIYFLSVKLWKSKLRMKFFLHFSENITKKTIDEKILITYPLFRAKKEITTCTTSSYL